jgi:glutathione synthase/RimK-type ligase-like ATP-grasp enzyme
VSRINPGSLPDNEKIFFDVLRRLSKDGLVGMPHPDSMINFGAKSALVKLNKTGLVPEDTDVYYDVEHFKKSFPVSLSHGERVLKQNRGSTGEGIWRVVYADER